MTGTDIHDNLARLPVAIEGLPHLGRLGALFSATVLLEVDETACYLTFDRGRLVDVSTGEGRKIPWHFAIRTDAAALAQFWRTLPEPGFHDIFGLAKIGRARIEGDVLLLVKNLRFVKEVMALPRQFEEAKA